VHPLPAAAEVKYGVDVVITRDHRNRTATSGWMVRLVRLYYPVVILTVSKTDINPIKNEMPKYHAHIFIVVFRLVPHTLSIRIYKAAILMMIVNGPINPDKIAFVSRLTINIPITTIHVSLKLCDESVVRVKRVIKNQRIPTDRKVPKIFILLANGEHVHPLPATREDELGVNFQTTINVANTAAGSGLHDADCSMEMDSWMPTAGMLEDGHRYRCRPMCSRGVVVLLPNRSEALALGRRSALAEKTPIPSRRTDMVPGIHAAPLAECVHEQSQKSDALSRK